MTACVSCRGLVKRYPPNVTAVDGLDLDVVEGECMGLLGPNGAGKTTTVEMIEGLTRPDAGEVTLFGQTWARGGRALRERLGVQLQQVDLLDRLTVRETVSIFRSFFREGRAPDEVVALVGLESKADAWVSKLSGGQRQRVALGCALVGSPDLLCLDEPTTGLDPQARRHLWDIVEAFKADGGTVLLTTHYMEEAARLCDRVAIVDAGKVIALGSPQELVARIGAAQFVVLTVDGADTTGDALAAAFDDVPTVESARGAGAEVTLGVSDVAAAMGPVLERVAQRGWTVVQLATHAATLEDVFVTLTGKALRE